MNSFPPTLDYEPAADGVRFVVREEPKGVLVIYPEDPLWKHVGLAVLVLLFGLGLATPWFARWTMSPGGVAMFVVVLLACTLVWAGVMCAMAVRVVRRLRGRSLGRRVLLTTSGQPETGIETHAVRDVQAVGGPVVFGRQRWLLQVTDTDGRAWVLTARESRPPSKAESSTKESADLLRLALGLPHGHQQEMREMRDA